MGTPRIRSFFMVYLMFLIDLSAVSGGTCWAVPAHAGPCPGGLLLLFTRKVTRGLQKCSKNTQECHFHYFLQHFWHPWLKSVVKHVFFEHGLSLSL